MSANQTMGICCQGIRNGRGSLGRKILYLPDTPTGLGIFRPEGGQFVEVVDMCLDIQSPDAQRPHVLFLSINAKKVFYRSPSRFENECAPCYHGDVALNMGQVHEWSEELKPFCFVACIDSVELDHGLGIELVVVIARNTYSKKKLTPKDSSFLTKVCRDKAAGKVSKEAKAWK